MEHPVGIEPWGNYYMSGGGPNIRDKGLGSLSTLSDALMLEVLGSGVLRASDMGRLALVSRSLYCFATLEELWKGMVMEELGGRFTWAGCWQRTYLVSTGLLPPAGAGPDGEDEEEEEEEEDDDDDEDEEASPATNGKGNAKGYEDRRQNGYKQWPQVDEKERAEEQSETRRQKRSKGAAGSGAGAERGSGKEMGQPCKRLKGGAVAEAVAESDKGGHVGAKGSGQLPQEHKHKQKHASGNGNTAPTDHNERKCATKAKTDGKGGATGKPPASEKCTALDEDEQETAAGPGPGSAAGVVAAAAQGRGRGRGRGRSLLRRVPVGGPQRFLRVRGFYSDLLYQPWFCATLEPPAEWLSVDNIDRRSGLTPEQFRREYDIPNRPVILTDVMSEWPAMQKWSAEYLQGVFGSSDVIVGNMRMSFSTYKSYCSSNHDEMPLYLFDKHFTATAPSLASDYTPPAQFGEDLFGLLGEGGRPDYRWLILGPARSGSSFHVDPNASSAWNALVWGAKKWVMYPPGAPPPGVHPSPDGADVATPLSLTEWFVNFYAATKESNIRPVEFVARPGELLFVPRGWWHCALNLEESCAITQNFVSEVGLPATLSFLKCRRPEMVSGCAHENRCDLYDRFVAALRDQRPGVLAAVEARQEEARARAREANKLAALFRPPTSAAGQQPGASGSAVAEDPLAPPGGRSGGGGFSFGFSFGGKDNEATASQGTNIGGGTSGGGFNFSFGL